MLLIVSIRKTCLPNQTLQPPCLPKLYHSEVLYTKYCLLLSPVSTSFVCVNATVHGQPYCFCFEIGVSLFVMLYSTYVPVIIVSNLPQTTVLCLYHSWRTVVELCLPVLTVDALVAEEMDIHFRETYAHFRETPAFCAYTTPSLQRCSGSIHL